MSQALAPWQKVVLDQLRDSLHADRLGHALLFAGPAGIGKRDVAMALAREVLCRGEGASAQRAARMFDAGAHPDFHLVSFVPNKAGDKLRSEIVIDQIRQLGEKLALTPQFGGAQVVIIDPADAINTAAANALLKTLEEPAQGRYLWLLSSEPARLPATIRSRCQQLLFRLPPRQQSLAWLQGKGHGADLAMQALQAARGHPGLAEQWLSGPGWSLRSEVERELASLASGRTPATELAQRWSGDDQLDMRLRHAAELAASRAACCGLTDPARLPKLAAWFDAANTTRRLLSTTVRLDLAVVELLAAWPQAAGDSPGGKRQ